MGTQSEITKVKSMKMNIRTEFLSILLIAVCIICNRATKLPRHVSIKDTTCDCPNTELISEGGFADKYPRYMGVWVNVGDYHDQPMYRCLQGCSALTDKLLFLREESDPTMGHWLSWTVLLKMLYFVEMLFMKQLEDLLLLLEQPALTVISIQSGSTVLVNMFLQGVQSMLQMKRCILQIVRIPNNN